jgi:UDP-glucose 4-epimerase
VSGPTSLVTGGAGFIGSHLADELGRLGHRVVVLDDLSGGFRDNVPATSELVEGSILDQALIRDLFETRRFDYVFHLAAYAAEGLSHFIKRFNYENNMIGSVNLINAAVNHDVKRFVFTSSIAVYGEGQVPMSEDAQPRPEDSYGIAKYAVEMELAATQRLFGLDYVIFRPHNVYGERQNIGDPYRNVIGIFMNQLMQDQPMTIFGDGEQKRAFTYIKDLAPIMARSVHERSTANQVINVGADTPYSVNELARAVADALGKRPAVKHLPRRHEVDIAYCSHAKLKQLLGFEARTSLSDGLARMASWALGAGPRRSKPFEQIEITRNLPPSWRQS